MKKLNFLGSCNEEDGAFVLNCDNKTPRVLKQYLSNGGARTPHDCFKITRLSKTGEIVLSTKIRNWEGAYKILDEKTILVGVSSPLENSKIEFHNQYFLLEVDGKDCKIKTDLYKNISAKVTENNLFVSENHLVVSKGCGKFVCCDLETQKLTKVSLTLPSVKGLKVIKFDTDSFLAVTNTFSEEELETVTEEERKDRGSKLVLFSITVRDGTVLLHQRVVLDINDRYDMQDFFAEDISSDKVCHYCQDGKVIILPELTMNKKSKCFILNTEEVEISMEELNIVKDDSEDFLTCNIEKVFKVDGNTKILCMSETGRDLYSVLDNG